MIWEALPVLAPWGSSIAIIRRKTPVKRRTAALLNHVVLLPPRMVTGRHLSKTTICGLKISVQERRNSLPQMGKRTLVMPQTMQAGPAVRDPYSSGRRIQKR
jgi:hypothetical protein